MVIRMTDDDISKIKQEIIAAYSDEVSEEYEDKIFQSYPFERARLHHNKAISEILSSDFSILSAPTGTGKTAVYLTAAYESGLPSIVIVPRNGLQIQISSYEMPFLLIPLFERSKECNKREGEVSPCAAKFRKDGRWYFLLNGEYKEYPCDDCPYEKKKYKISELLKDANCCPILNQGNFFRFLHDAEFIIVDEADETLKSIQSAISHKISHKISHREEDVDVVLDIIYNETREECEHLISLMEEERDHNTLVKLNAKLNKLTRKLRKIEFFTRYYESCGNLITYIRGNRTYVEIFEDPIETARRIFAGKKVCLVSATLKSEHAKEVYFEHPFRQRVISAKIANLSMRSVSKDNNVLKKAASFIEEICDFVSNLTSVRVIIHAGNLHTHGKYIYDMLKDRKAILMERGKQTEAITKFLKGDYDILIGVAMEHGYDLSEVALQFVLKVPYSDLKDPRIAAIKKKLKNFDEWYCLDALHRLIQACGRNARSPNDFAITIIVDECFERLYKQFEHKIPEWFKKRVVSVERGDDNDKIWEWCYPTEENNS